MNGANDREWDIGEGILVDQALGDQVRDFREKHQPIAEAFGPVVRCWSGQTSLGDGTRFLYAEYSLDEENNTIVLVKQRPHGFIDVVVKTSYSMVFATDAALREPHLVAANMGYMAGVREPKST
jgi:hypothetical protein